MDTGENLKLKIKFSFSFFYLLTSFNKLYLMTIKFDSLKINTNKSFEIIDITSKIDELIDIDEGIISIFSKHSTFAIVVNENEEGLLGDLEFCLDNIVSDKFSYSHDTIGSNARSHLKSFSLSSSECLPIKNARLAIKICEVYV